jgi:hypothetical protein
LTEYNFWPRAKRPKLVESGTFLTYFQDAPLSNEWIIAFSVVAISRVSMEVIDPILAPPCQVPAGPLMLIHWLRPMEKDITTTSAERKVHFIDTKVTFFSLDWYAQSGALIGTYVAIRCSHRRRN